MKYLTLTLMFFSMTGCAVPITLVNDNRIFWEKEGAVPLTELSSLDVTTTHRNKRLETQDVEGVAMVEPNPEPEMVNETTTSTPLIDNPPTAPVLKDLTDLSDDKRLIVLAKYVVALRLYLEDLQKYYTQNDQVGK